MPDQTQPPQTQPPPQAPAPQQGAFSAYVAAQPQDPLDFSNKYNTPIPANRQGDFNKWVESQTQATGRSPLNDRYDYDVNGYFLSGAGNDPRGHGPDTFKKPNHPTFSDESQYHGVDGYHGGTWITSNGGSFYQPSPTNIRMHGADGLKAYFNKVEPDTQLLVPPQSPASIGKGVIK